MKKAYILYLIFVFSMLSTGCVSYQSIETNHKKNACLMMTENYDWLVDLKNSKDKWGIPISVQLAFIKQESNFKHDARPYVFENGRKKLASSAFGYSQAINGTWKQYLKETKRINGDRTNFTDAVDFMGWYNQKSVKELKLNKLDVYNLYLAYHEGHNGFKKRTYNKKDWLKKVAKNVEKQAINYSKQLNMCNINYY